MTQVEPLSDPDQDLLRATARQFFEQRFPLDDLKRRESADDFDQRAWTEIAELGWTGLAIPEERGGSGGGLCDLALLCAEGGRVLLPLPLLAVTVAAAAALETCEAPEATSILKETASGAMRPVLAVGDERGRWFPATLGIVLEHGKLNGVAHFVEAVDAADVFLVAAKTTAGPEVVMVEAADPRVARTRQRSMAGSHWGRIEIKDAPAFTIEGDWRAVRKAMSRVGAMQAAWSAGAGSRLLEETVDYANSRVQFGVPIGSFQAVQHRLADCATAVTESATLAMKAAALLEEGHSSARRLASTAFVHGSACFVRVARSCHQIWGGMGFSTEAHVHHFSRRAKTAQHQWGGPVSHLELIAEELRGAPLVIDRYRHAPSRDVQ